MKVPCPSFLCLSPRIRIILPLTNLPTTRPLKSVRFALPPLEWDRPSSLTTPRYVPTIFPHPIGTNLGSYGGGVSLRRSRALWEFTSEAPALSKGAWKLFVKICEDLIATCDFSISEAVGVLRWEKHREKAVPERDVVSLECLLGLGVLPLDLETLLRNRALHGTPSFFANNPKKRGADRMHPSAPK